MKRPHRMSLSLSLLCAAGLAAGLAAAPVGARAAASTPAIDSQYRQARQQARADFNENLRFCREDAMPGVRDCQSLAREDYQADLAAAHDDYVAARQKVPLTTPEARFENARREASAAYAYNKNACRQAGHNRSECMQEAAQRYKVEMLQARTERARENLDRMAEAHGAAQSMRGASDNARQSDSFGHR